MTENEKRDVLVTVVIPAMNRRLELASAIGSVIATGFRSLEIIVVDDGSTDGTNADELCEIDPRVRVISHPQNRGAPAARNSGIDAASGKLVAFLDSDDRWLPDRLDQQIGSHDQDGRAGVDRIVDNGLIVASNVFVEQGESRFIHNQRAPRHDEPIDRYLMSAGQALQTSTLLVPTALARIVRFREDLKRHQDWDFVLRLLGAGAKLEYHHEPAAVYVLAGSGRISSDGRRVNSTLHWMSTARTLVTDRAIHDYVASIIVSRDLTRNPSAVARAAFFAVRLGPLGPLALSVAIVRRLLDKTGIRPITA